MMSYVPIFALKAFDLPFSMKNDRMTEVGGNKVEKGPFSFRIVTGDDGQDLLVHITITNASRVSTRKRHNQMSPL